MKIGVLGTGMVGNAIASKLVALAGSGYLPIPIGHIGTADDVARVAVFLASVNAAFVNGAVVRVDGGSYSWAG